MCAARWTLLHASSMIGHDIVDLRAAKMESDPLRGGWAKKVLSEPEQAWAAKSDDPATLCWRLWAAKEAAYKAHIRCGGKPGLYPYRIFCDPENQTALIERQRYFLKWEASDAKIMAFAAGSSDILAQIIAVPPSKIIKINDLPYAKCPTGWKPASVSHHGIYHEAVTLEDEAWFLISGTPDQ